MLTSWHLIPPIKPPQYQKQKTPKKSQNIHSEQNPLHYSDLFFHHPWMYFVYHIEPRDSKMLGGNQREPEVYLKAIIHTACLKWMAQEKICYDSIDKFPRGTSRCTTPTLHTNFHPRQVVMAICYNKRNTMPSFLKNKKQKLFWHQLLWPKIHFIRCMNCVLVWQIYIFTWAKRRNCKKLS